MAYAFAGGLFEGEWSSVWIIALIGITHGSIDYLKLTYGNQRPLYSFLIGQAVYVFILLLTWLWITNTWGNASRLIKIVFTNQHFVAILSGYLICTTPIGFVVGMATNRWQRQLTASDTLAEAGKWIGITERVLIFSFVLLNQYEAISFLIAAKSLLRFREGEQAAKQSEYVLVGTLLSYSLAILMGLLIKLTIE